MLKIAIFIANYYIGNSPSILNLLNLLSEHYTVDLFLHAVELKRADVLNKVNVIEVGSSGPLGFLREKIRARLAGYEKYICIDPHGFVICKKLVPNARPFYYSLELYLKDDHYGLYYPDDVMKKERKEINSIKGLIIQSAEKEALFRKDYNLATEIPVFLIPVTYNGSHVLEKSSFIRTKYKISEDKRIALHLGGTAKYHSGVELAKAFSGIRDWVLLFHGFSDREYLEELKSAISGNNISNVIISDELYDSIDDVDRVVMSCDVGIAWYNNISAGFRTVGKSSGKIAAYLRFGLPVIATKYPSTLDAIEKTGCGLCIDTFDELNEAIFQIEKNYEHYSKNAISEYDRTYYFDKYKDGLLNFIEGHTSY